MIFRSRRKLQTTALTINQSLGGVRKHAAFLCERDENHDTSARNVTKNELLLTFYMENCNKMY